ncbi:hypothetical protein FACS1894217_09880 [Clostridia bacterium]|nr:hypothetical protein FACS1894217_09880 [Clostridia bacterium]
MKNSKTAKTSELFARLTSAFVAIMLAVFPLYLDGNMYGGLTGHKAKFFWTLMVLMLVAMLVLWLAFLGNGDKQRRSWSVIDIAALAYLLVMILSAVFSPFVATEGFWYMLTGKTTPVTNERWDGLFTHGSYILIYFIVSRNYRPHLRDMSLFAVSACVVSLIGLVQFLGYDPIFPYEQQGMLYPYAWQDTLFRTTLGNVDIVSCYVALTVVLFAALYCQTKTKIRFLYLAAASLSVLMMIIGDADSGKLGSLTGLIILFAVIITDRVALSKFFVFLGASALLLQLRSWALVARVHFEATGQQFPVYADKINTLTFIGVAVIALGVGLKYLPVWIHFKPWKAAVVTLALIVIAGVAGLNYIGERETNRGSVLWQANEVLHGRIEDEFGTWRGFIWIRTMQIIPDHPLIGTGPDTFGQAFDRFQNEAWEKTQVVYDKAHNDVLQVAVCSGLIGLGLYLVWTLGAMFCGFRRIYKSPIMMGVTLALAAVFVQSLFGVSVPIATPLFFVLLGILVAEARRMGDPIETRYHHIKRGADVVFSLVLLVILSPFALIARIFMHPMLFVQKRFGRGKKFFNIYKLRSMRRDTPDVATHLLEDRQKYVTPLGKFLRKTSLDELPQLWNVLRGDMSVVGPRPALWNQDDLIAERDKYGANYVQPGMTGLAQLQGELPVPDKARLDGQYVKEQSLLLDLKIFFGTFGVVLRGRKA